MWNPEIRDRLETEVNQLNQHDSYAAGIIKTRNIENLLLSKRTHQETEIKKTSTFTESQIVPRHSFHVSCGQNWRLLTKLEIVCFY